MRSKGKRVRPLPATSRQNSLSSRFLVPTGPLARAPDMRAHRMLFSLLVTQFAALRRSTVADSCGLWDAFRAYHAFGARSELERG